MISDVQSSFCRHEPPLSDKELAKVEIVYLYDRSNDIVRSGREVVETL